MKMKAKGILVILALVVLAVAVESDPDTVTKVKTVRGKKVCTKGWECNQWSQFCCNETITDYFQVYQFEEWFSKRNSPVAHAVGFWDFQSFILAAAQYEPLGFGTTGNKTEKMKEVAAFLGHVGSQTSCGYGVATGGPLAWGLCFSREMSPSHSYCDDFYKYTYPWAPGAEYYGCGALPIYCSPSAHDAFVGNWKPTKNDTLSKRVPGFGATMNILYAERTCGQGDIDAMNTIISHYLYYLDLLGVGREQAGPNEVLSCAEQVAFNPISQHRNLMSST
ncbi:hypothetical protein SO802_022334 [Lithocarpus litseifolius]|uniref:Glycoside hydrolase family 19 catalytic domain-containing protein n=1 Tax=Lithocarpus litseifolius TaxID=425828 RepID=A0AAW2CIU5_9ROSI